MGRFGLSLVCRAYWIDWRLSAVYSATLAQIADQDLLIPDADDALAMSAICFLSAKAAVPLSANFRHPLHHPIEGGREGEANLQWLLWSRGYMCGYCHAATR
ncbi:hypothetical protein GCM10007884_36710 [Methylobacterium brachythecii]|uniref:Uncharacterized protein n=1 Tax=Methylobacterium brachythecii TaxID=1176177 RepID=A0ABQ6D6L4_9HYPH|nr:hypothetical protein GCM10007884_36710 [Methylobacterium brachythecii]